MQSFDHSLVFRKVQNCTVMYSRSQEPLTLAQLSMVVMLITTLNAYFYLKSLMTGHWTLLTLTQFLAGNWIIFEVDNLWWTEHKPSLPKWRRIYLRTMCFSSLILIILLYVVTPVWQGFYHLPPQFTKFICLMFIAFSRPTTTCKMQWNL